MTNPSPLSWILALATALLAFVAARLPEREETLLASHKHKLICVLCFAAGAYLRLIYLPRLPEGLSAGEALLGVEAKSLLQNGHFLFETGLPVRLAFFTNDAVSPLLIGFAAPFVAIFGMNALAVRLPLALFSCAALPAAYGIGKHVAGQRGGRMMLAFIALSPSYALTSRLAETQAIALPLLILALYACLRGMQEELFIVPAMLLLGILPFAQDVFLVASPLMIICLTIILIRCGKKAYLVLPAALTGILFTLPGLLTIYASRPGGSAFHLGFCSIPHVGQITSRIERFQRLLHAAHPPLAFFRQAWSVTAGGFFQDVMHENIDYAWIAGEGLSALHLFSVPLAITGLLMLVRRFLSGKRPLDSTKLLDLFFAVVFLSEIFFGSAGFQAHNGETSIWDYTALFPFTAVLACLGASKMAAQSRFMKTALVVVFALGGVQIATQFVDGTLQSHANIAFTDFPEAILRASHEAELREMPLRVTTAVYPHTDPDEAAEMMTLFALNADMRVVTEDREAYAEIFWAEGEDAPASDAVTVVSLQESRNWFWDAEAFDYEKIGRYALLVPRTKEE